MSNTAHSSTPTEFQPKTVYRFEFDKVYYYSGTDKWFILKNPQTGLNTIPGYEDERWLFRVKPLPFQQDWDEDDAREWNTFDCEVIGFNLDPETNEETGFPLLRQSGAAVLAKLYPESDFGTARQLRVVNVPGDVSKNGKTINGFILGDDTRNGYTFPANASVFGPALPKRDDILTLHVSADGKHTTPHIQTEEEFLEDEKIRNLLATVPEVFSEGAEYEAEVLPSKGYDSRFVWIRISVMPELPCRIPARRDIPVSPGDRIRLRCIGFGTSGFPKWAFSSTPVGVPVDDLPMLELSSLQESLTLEFKSSLVYPNSGATEPDIDKQLGFEIARVVASFMNREGGVVYVGVNDDGEVVGIEKEADKLNAHSDSSHKYPPTLDGMRNKIVDTLSAHLGKGAVGLLDVTFFADKNKRLVCKISVRANQTPVPVFLDGKKLYVRYPGSSRHLEGDDLVRYILDRNATGTESSPVPSPAVVPAPVPLPVSFSEVRITRTPLVKADPSAVHRYLNLFSTGEASRTTKLLPETEPNCFCRLPVPDGAWNKKSRLLFCYDSGRVNILNPKQVLETTLKSRNVRHANGFDRTHGMMAAAICDENDILVIRTQHKNGTIYVKGVPVGKCTVHVTMGTLGNDLTGLEKMPAGSKVLDYRILPGARADEVKVLKPQKGNSIGVDQTAIADIWAVLEKLPILGIPR